MQSDPETLSSSHSSSLHTMVMMNKLPTTTEVRKHFLSLFLTAIGRIETKVTPLCCRERSGLVLFPPKQLL